MIWRDGRRGWRRSLRVDDGEERSFGGLVVGWVEGRGRLAAAVEQTAVEQTAVEVARTSRKSKAPKIDELEVVNHHYSTSVVYVRAKSKKCVVCARCSP